LRSSIEQSTAAPASISSRSDDDGPTPGRLAESPARSRPTRRRWRDRDESETEAVGGSGARGRRFLPTPGRFLVQDRSPSTAQQICPATRPSPYPLPIAAKAASVRCQYRGTCLSSRPVGWVWGWGATRPRWRFCNRRVCVLSATLTRGTTNCRMYTPEPKREILRLSYSLLISLLPTSPKKARVEQCRRNYMFGSFVLSYTDILLCSLWTLFLKKKTPGKLFGY
jgi:hypothetical protein